MVTLLIFPTGPKEVSSETYASLVKNAQEIVERGKEEAETGEIEPVIPDIPDPPKRTA